MHRQSATDATANPPDIASLSPAQLRALLAEQACLITEQAHVIAEREGAIADHRRVIADKDHVIDEQQKLLKLLEAQLRLAKQQRFGSSSEKLAFQGDFSTRPSWSRHSAMLSRR